MITGSKQLISEQFAPRNEDTSEKGHLLACLKVDILFTGSTVLAERLRIVYFF
jgi:hypothetical protein